MTTNAIMNTQKIDSPAGIEALREIEKQLATEVPALHELNQEQLQQIAQIVLINSYTDTMKKDVDLQKINYEEKKQVFLDRTRSDNTRNGYKYAFNSFEAYIKEKGLQSPLYCTPSIADAYIYYLQHEGKAPATIRRNVACISSFFSFLERETEGLVKNVYRGTKALPKKEPTKQIEKEIPTTNLSLFEKDIKTIIKNEDNPELKAIITIMAYRGLRCGAFSNMTIYGNRYFTTSKGKTINGILPAICMKAIQENDIKKQAPFTIWTSDKLKSTFQYHIRKLYEAGKITYKYSCHDLRHFYALTEYTKNKDIYRLSKLLNHASISVTEIYLRGLKVIE